MAPMVGLTRDRSWWGESARSMLFWQRQPLHLRENGADQKEHRLRHAALASRSFTCLHTLLSLWFQSQLDCPRSPLRTDA